MGEVKLQSGDVLVDGSMIVNAVNAIQIGLIDDEGVDFVRFNSLAQLIQVLVTHNRLITISAPMHGFEGKGHAITGWIRNSEYCNCSLDTTWQRVILDNTRSIALNTKKANLVHRQVESQLSDETTVSSWREDSRFFAAEENHRNEVLGRVGSDYGFEGSFLYNTLCYFHCAVSLRIPYLPHCLRSSMVGEIFARDTAFTKSFAELALEYINKTRGVVVANVNEFAGCTMFDVTVPFIFLRAIQECRHFSDLPTIVSQIRDSDEAEAFRKWASHIDELTVDGDLKSVYKAVSDVESVANQWLKTLGYKSDFISLKLPIGSVQARVPPLFQRAFRPFRNRYLSFLYNLLLVGERHNDFMSKLRKIASK